jgi:predicted phage terminase large subunit-like protein
MDEFKNKTGNLDYFAMAYVAKLPGGGAVVVDGVLEHTTQAQAETLVNRAQTIFPNWLNAVVEADVRGEDFIQVITRNPGLRIIPMKTGGKGKGVRLERQMSPWLENGFVRISDADTPFLNELRHELDLYPNCAHDDALDALYWALRGMPDVLTLGRESVQEEILEPKYQGAKQENPFIAFGSR